MCRAVGLEQQSSNERLRESWLLASNKMGTQLKSLKLCKCMRLTSQAVPLGVIMTKHDGSACYDTSKAQASRLQPCAGE